MIQLKAFESHLLRVVYLGAPESKRRAFYTIWIERSSEGFRVCKESGGGGKVLHRQSWDLEALEEAGKLFSKKLREKTSPNRKNRIYRVFREVSRVDPSA